MHHPDHFLRRAHRRARGVPLVWALALAAFACALSLAQSLGWLPAASAAASHAPDSSTDASSSVVGHWSFVVPALAPAVLAAASLVVLIIWIRRARRLDAASTARELDSAWKLAARLEASAELSADRSALAAAQRADAAAHVAARPAPRAAGWFSGLGLLVLAALFLSSELAVISYRFLARDSDHAAGAKDPARAAADDIAATLDWRSPEAEIKATAIEEVPLAALATTRTGFRTVSLEVSVNGVPRLSRPLDPATLAPLGKAGAHPVELSLFLDEAGVQEFDLVAYNLQGERATARPAPLVASPLQFIQIRPPREDVIRIKADKGTPLDKLATLLGNLKAAQVQLMKQNFLLTHAPIDHALPAWRDENTRVAADQKTLAQKVAEARDYAIAESMPTLVVDNLGQAQPLMENAADKITATDNPAATPPQGQALGLIVACEKLIQKIIIEGGRGGGKPPPLNNDPFKDKQVYKLPPRKDTPAGQLEELAQRQDATAQALSPSGEGKPRKDPLAEQAELAQKLGALSNPGLLSEAARQKAADAARDAAEAARQLQAGDAEAARAPAAAAAEALREAVAAQEAAGRATAQAELENQRRAINEAERLADPAERAAALAGIAEALREEATQQQQTGSAEAARQLAATADKVAEAARAAATGRPAAPEAASEAPATAAAEKGAPAGAGQESGSERGNSPSANPASPGDASATAAAGKSKSAGTQPGAQTAANSPSPGQPGNSPGASPAPSGAPASSPGQSSGAAPGTSPGSNSAPGESLATGQSGSGSSPVGSSSPSGGARLPRDPLSPAARAAARAQAALTPRDQALARAVRQLSRASQTGNGGSGVGGGSPTNPAAAPNAAEVELAVQFASELVTDTEAREVTLRLASTFRNTAGSVEDILARPEVRDAISRLVLRLEAARQAGQRDEIVRRYNPEDLDPAYRPAVETYFEKLSRDGAKP